MRTKVSLIVQDGVMIPQGETPVLVLSESSGRPDAEMIAKTVNFLRSHCRSVQWLMSPVSGWTDLVDKNHSNEFLISVQAILLDLSILGEQFKVEAPEDQDDWKPGTVVTITRKVTSEPATRPIAYGALESGKSFRLTDTGWIMMKLANGKGSVRMDERMRGVIREPQFCPLDHEVVQEILG